MCGRIRNIDWSQITLDNLVRQTLEEVVEIRNGNIGEPQRHIEFEPLPDEVPVTEPAAPAVQPETAPV